MIRFIKKLRAFISPPISPEKAIRRIVQKACIPSAGSFTVYSEKPENCSIYNFTEDIPCWVVYAPWNDSGAAPTLQSSHVIVISRQTGMEHKNFVDKRVAIDHSVFANRERRTVDDFKTARCSCFVKARGHWTG